MKIIITLISILLQLIYFISVSSSSESTVLNISETELDLNDTATLTVVLNNLTRCSITELSLKTESLVYTWDMKGFLGYYGFMEKFEQNFEVKTEQISFKSDIVDGKWFFKVSKMSSYEGVVEVTISSTYSYEAKQQKKLNFYVQLSLIHNEKEIFLPVQKSSNPVVQQQRLYNRRGYSNYLEYVHAFTWPGTDQAISNIFKKLNQNQNDDGGVYSDNSSGVLDGDITLKFQITAYYPSDPVYSFFENCPSSTQTHSLISDGDFKNYALKKPLSPPYMKHSYSMLHDDRFTDIKFKAGDQILMAHKIILASSSPVFSALFDNDTETASSILADFPHSNNNNDSIGLMSSHFDTNSNIIDLDVSPEVAKELLGYIYTGRVSINNNVADKLIRLASVLELQDLKKLCERYLYNKITPDNAVEMYKLGHEVGAEKIIRRAFVVIKANKSKIVTESEEFQRLTATHPELMFELFVA